MIHGLVLPEPEVEFGGDGRHIDPRHGIATYGPLDVGQPTAPERIRIGLVGSQAAVQGIREWLARAREPLAPKTVKYAKQQRMFPGFPGFDPDHTFRSLLVFEERNIRALSSRALKTFESKTGAGAIRAAVDAYMEEIDWLTETDRCDVIICARPESIDMLDLPSTVEDRGEELTAADVSEDAKHAVHPDFHDQLKAAALRTTVPIQLIRPETWEDKTKPPHGVQRRKVQDPATRAWNLHTALYYKAGGTPWRLIRTFADVTTCYLGISFYRSADGQKLHTSVAQLFNERGEGVVVRGGPAPIIKDDRQPHLSEDDAAELLRKSVAAYRQEHQTLPARLVIHKTSRFTESERAGFTNAADALMIDRLEMIWVTDREPARLFRSAEHPPLRGTAFQVSDDRFVLYTGGSVEFYGAYPGMYVPAPIGLRPVDSTTRLEDVAAETLALTKLNWNHTQLDGHLPITLQAAAKVKAILRWVPNDAPPARRYASYM